MKLEWCIAAIILPKGRASSKILLWRFLFYCVTRLQVACLTCQLRVKRNRKIGSVLSNILWRSSKISRYQQISPKPVVHVWWIILLWAPDNLPPHSKQIFDYGCSVALTHTHCTKYDISLIRHCGYHFFAVCFCTVNIWGQHLFLGQSVDITDG